MTQEQPTPNEAKTTSAPSDRPSPIVGIDLGTTNSVVAAIIDGKPTVFSEGDEQVLPSVVGLSPDGKLITGIVARNQLAAFPDRTVASIKRKMGTNEPIQLGDQTFTPREISSMILRRLRDRASRQLGTDVTRAVITVPAFFDEIQRQATREAGELAGFKIERIINEPTAATLVYHAGEHDAKTIIVYDFGGGTFDVSIVRFEDGVVEVLSSKGDTHLGGDDIDQLLLEHVAQQFQKEHDIDLLADPTTRFRLLQACEQAKCRLSQDASTHITETFIAEKDGNPLNLDIEITRPEFEELIAPLIDRTIECVDEALRDVGMNIRQIDDLVLVGGSTRLPLVEQRLREEFGNQPSRAVDPDLAVAYGAATQAAMLDGQSVGPVLIDVTSHTLGIEVLDSSSLFRELIFSPMIHRNTPLPATFEQTYSRVYEDQEQAEIHVLQGEYRDVQKNTTIGKFTIDLDSSEDSQDQIIVRFTLTLDGLLVVTANQVGSDNSNELTIENALDLATPKQRTESQSRLTEMFDESEEILDESELAAEHSQKEWGSDEPSESSDAACSEAILNKYPAAAALLKQVAELGSDLPTDDADDIQSATRELKKAMTAEDDANVTRCVEELDDILFYVQ